MWHKAILNIFLVILAVACASKKEAELGLNEPLSEQASIQYQFAYEFFRAGDMIRALNAGLKAVELSPRNADAHNLLGLIHFRQGTYDKAEQSFKEAIRLNPKMSEAYNNIGTLYYETGRYSEAKVALEMALENPLYLYPERVYNNLGLVYKAMGNLEEAQASYEKAISFRQDYYLPYLNYGEFWLEQGEFKRAKPLLREAAKLCSDCSGPRYHLGQIMIRENKMDEAIKLFKAGFEMDPKGYYGQLCRQFLVESGNIKDE